MRFSNKVCFNDFERIVLQSLFYCVALSSFIMFFCIAGCTVDFGPGEAVCGNGVMEGDELCDGDDFGGKTCSDYTGYEHGELVCNPGCKLEVSKCHTCGNGFIEGPEECDGDNLGGTTCAGLGAEEGGELLCKTDCTFDKSACVGLCSNGVIEDEYGEVCDGSNMGGIDCTSLGYNGGMLACLSDCTGFDTSNCGAKCGNGVIDEEEVCDGEDLAGETCETFGYNGGTLTCFSDCTGFDTSDCGIYCGNEVIDEGEICDSDKLAGETCETLEFGGGTLACGADCKSFDTSGCFTCGNGVCEAGKGETVVGCSEDCGWEQISVGNWHACAVKKDGSAWCWGTNYDGALGIGSSLNEEVSLRPVRVSGMNNGVHQIAAGHWCTCAVKTNDTLWCWGNNVVGQLGIGTTGPPENAPVQVIELDIPNETIQGVDIHKYHGCAISVGGTLWCWGSGDNGRLGVDTLVNHSAPVEVTALSGVVQVSVGDSHTCAIKTDDAVWCWGDNSDGKLGLGMDDGPEICLSNPCSKKPVQVDWNYEEEKTSISAGFFHTCMASNSGVWCWGSNSYSQLGDTTLINSSSPVRVHGLQGASALGLGIIHSCALAQEGSVWCWGSGDSGQIGEGGPINDDLVQTTPLQVAGLPDAVDLDAHYAASCAIDSEGQAWCWGYNGQGVLGDGTTENRNYPVQVLEPN